MSEEEKSKKTFIEWINEHPKSTFLLRAIAWVTLAGVLPFAFIAWRYGIFKTQGTIALSGWGIIGILIAGFVIISLLNYFRKGLEDGMLKQCLVGICKIVLPLLIVLLIVHGIKNNINLFETALVVVIVCELLAIPVNPFPEWLAKRKKEQNLKEQEGAFEAMWNKFFAKKKENESDGEQ